MHFIENSEVFYTCLSSSVYDYIWTDSWDYGADPKYTGELGPNLPYKRYPTSYTPPGWMRLYKYRKVLKPSAKPKSLDVLFEF